YAQVVRRVRRLPGRGRSDRGGTPGPGQSGQGHRGASTTGAGVLRQPAGLGRTWQDAPVDDVVVGHHQVGADEETPAERGAGVDPADPHLYLAQTGAPPGAVLISPPRRGRLPPRSATATEPDGRTPCADCPFSRPPCCSPAP